MFGVSKYLYDKSIKTVRGEGVRRSIEWLILHLIKVGARLSYHAKHWYVHVSTAFPLAHHCQEVFDSG